MKIADDHWYTTYTGSLISGLGLFQELNDSALHIPLSLEMRSSVNKTILFDQNSLLGRKTRQNQEYKIPSE